MPARFLRAVHVLFATLGLLLVSSRALAAYVPPPLEGPVTDPGRVLSDSDRAAINAKLRRHKETTGVGINVFIPKSLEGQTIEDVAYDTARTWKLGSGGVDEGVLLVWAPSERKVRIETAKGIGDRLPDVETFHIQRDIINPKLKAGQNRQALEDGVDAIAKAIGPKSGAKAGAARPGANPNAGPSAGRALAGGALFLVILIGGGGLLFVVFLVFVLKKLFSGGRRDQSYYSHHHDPYVHNQQNDYGSPGIFYSGGGDSGGSSDWGGGSSDSGGGGDWGGGGDSGGGDWGGGGSSSDY